MRFNTKTLFVCLSAACLALAASRYWWLAWGEGAAFRLEKSLETMEEVEDAEVFGFWDSPFDYKIVDVNIRLRGGRSLVIKSPSSDLHGAFRLHRIDSFEVQFSGQSPGWFHFPQFGPEGDFTPLLPEGFTSIESLITNYDLALETISNWPSSETDGLRVEGAGGKYLVWKEEVVSQPGR